MEHILSGYGSLLIPAVIAIVLLYLVFKVVSMILKLVTLVLLVAILFGGFQMYSRISTMQQAVDAMVSQGKTTMTTDRNLAHVVGISARQVLSETGLNPVKLHVHIICDGPNTQIQVRYADDGFLFGMLNHYYDVPHDSRIGCPK